MRLFKSIFMLVFQMSHLQCINFISECRNCHVCSQSFVTDVNFAVSQMLCLLSQVCHWCHVFCATHFVFSLSWMSHSGVEFTHHLTHLTLSHVMFV